MTLKRVTCVSHAVCAECQCRNPFCRNTRVSDDGPCDVAAGTGAVSESLPRCADISNSRSQFWGRLSAAHARVVVVAKGTALLREAPRAADRRTDGRTPASISEDCAPEGAARRAPDHASGGRRRTHSIVGIGLTSLRFGRRLCAIQSGHGGRTSLRQLRKASWSFPSHCAGSRSLFGLLPVSWMVG
jgi:hypothetical protein